MVNRHTVNVIDVTGDEPSIKRSKSYDDIDDALDAVQTLADFVNFETEKIEFGGSDSIQAWLDELDAQSEPRTRTAHFWMPEVGDVLNDPEAPHWSNGDVRITGVTETPASEYEIDDPINQTVANANPGHPTEAPVVKAKYLGGSGREYAFPITRLERP